MDLTKITTIAFIGLSDKPHRPSYQVAQYFLHQGYKIIPVNPNVSQVFGQKSYPTIISIPKDITIDVFNIFRKSEEIEPIIQEIISSGRHSTVWLQEAGNLNAAKLAKLHHLEIISGICFMKFHQQNSRR